MTTVNATQDHTIESIVDQLDRFRQRATYGAVAGVLNRAPRNLMGGRSRGQRDSWIVSRKDGMPTGYPEEDLHPDIKARDKVIETPDELRRWLENPE